MDATFEKIFSWAELNGNILSGSIFESSEENSQMINHAKFSKNFCEYDIDDLLSDFSSNLFHLSDLLRDRIKAGWMRKRSAPYLFLRGLLSIQSPHSD